MTIRHLLLPAWFVAALVNPSQAQPAGNIPVVATVMSNLVVESRQELLLGDILAGETKRVDVDGSTNGAEIGGEQPGVFRIGSSGRIHIRFDDLPDRLIGTEAINSGAFIPVRFFASWSPTATGASNGMLIDPTSEWRLEAGGSASSDIFVFVGAEVQAPTTQREGLYATTITLVVTYGIE